MIFTITEVGMAAENEAIIDGSMPVFDKLFIGDGAVAQSPFKATELTHKVFDTQVLVAERLSEGAIRLHAHIPAEQEMLITEIGLMLNDGTLYAYAPYSTETNGFFKAKGFDFTLQVILSRQQLPDLTFNYTPIDVQAIANQIRDSAQNAIDTHIQGYLIGLVIHTSLLTHDLNELRLILKQKGIL